MGDLLSTHQGRWWGGRMVPGIVASAALGLALGGFGLFAHGKNPALAVLFGLGFVVVAVALGVAHAREVRTRLDLYQGGLRWTNGAHTVELPWAAVHSVTVLTMNGKAARYTLHTTKGDLALHSSLSGFDHLATLLSRVTGGVPRP